MVSCILIVSLLLYDLLRSITVVVCAAIGVVVWYVLRVDGSVIPCCC